MAVRSESRLLSELATFLFPQSILHTRRKETGWVIPGAHYLRNLHTPVGKAKVITANGQSVDVEPFPPNKKENEAAGTQYSGKFPGNRVFEPIVLYHYVQRGASVRSHIDEYSHARYPNLRGLIIPCVTQTCR